MRKEELIQLAKELNEETDLKGREKDLLFLKREYTRINNREEETFFEKSLTDKFNKYFELLKDKFADLSKSSLEDKKDILKKANELVQKEGGEKTLLKSLNDLFNNFKHLPKCTKEQDDELFLEFRKIKEEANKKVDAYYKNVKQTILDRKAKKEELIKSAQEVLQLESIKEGTTKMNSLMDEWKKVGFAGDEDQNLWEQFKEVRKQFNEKKRAHFENMAKVFEERANKKAELIKKVKQITADAYFTKEEINEIKNIDKEFRNIGFAGKEKDQQLFDEMQAAVRKYFDEMKFYK